MLTNNRAPISWTIQTKHTARKPLLYFVEESGINKEIRYATNQRSLFVEDQDGAATLAHIVFLDGVLYAPKEQQNLQKLLSLYHPERNSLWMEVDEVQEAEDEIDALEGDEVEVFEDSPPEDTILGVDIFSAVHKKTKQKIYVSAEDIKELDIGDLL